MTGPEQMANSLIRSITGMSIDEIKASAFRAQQLVLQFVEDVKTKMDGVQKSLDAIENTQYNINATQDAQREALSENADIQNLILKKLDIMHEDIISVLEAQTAGVRLTLDVKFDNVLFHLAQIEHAIKLPLEPDMLDILRKKAMMGLVDLGEAVTLNPTQVIPIRDGEEQIEDGVKTDSASA